MSAFKGTPGPWFVPVDDPYVVTLAPPPVYGLGDPSSSRVHLATTHMDNRLQAPYVEARANAAAIAQVPAMIDVLLALVEDRFDIDATKAARTILAALRAGGAL